MAIRVALGFMRDSLRRKIKVDKDIYNPRKYFCTASPATAQPSRPLIPKKIPHFSKKGRLFTGATIGLLIGGFAYASTVDEATFWSKAKPPDANILDYF